MRKRLAPMLLLLASALFALAAPALAAQAAPLTHWRSGLIEINDGWAEHDGDNLAWASAGFDDSTWQKVDIEDMGPASRGWHWFRKHVRVGPDYPHARLLIQAGDGLYEVYVNGQRMDGARIRSSFNVRRPIERVFAIDNDDGDFTIALRTHTPTSYTDYDLPLVLSITLGQRTAISYEQSALESSRIYYAVPSIAINLMLVLAALAAFALFRNQRTHREYMFLGFYLLLVGLSNGIWVPQQAGLLPTSANLLFADPLTYLFNIAQIEFTFSFAGRKVSRAWRTYEAILLAPLLLVIPCWLGMISSNGYVLLEATVEAPVALLLPVMLFRWYRHGNREAGWLILPSLLPAATGALYDLGSASIYLDWRWLDFLTDSISIGPVDIHIADAASLLFLLAIGAVMFFRFTRVSREQAHAEVELEAAREVQRRLVAPAASAPGFKVESAYLPAAHVGGDFYLIRTNDDGSMLVVVGDVSGKGLPAALGVSAIIGALRAMPDLPPGALLAALNHGLHGNVRDGFVTCVAVRVESDGTATLANAGHIPPYLDGAELALEPSLPLGMIAGAQYSETTLKLEAGQRLTLLTDGVVEAQNSDGELFGFERTAAISTETAQKVAQAAQAFGQEDDITVLTLTFVPIEVAHA